MRRILLPVLPFLFSLVTLGVSPLAAQLTTGDQLLTTPSWVAAHLNDPDLILLQVGPREDYDREHIPGTRFVELEMIATGRGPSGSGQAQEGLALELPTPADLRTRLETLGIGDRSKIVVVQSQDWVSPATRVLFTLGVAGLSDRATLLDGGLAAWKKSGGALTAEVPAITPGRLTVAPVAGLVVDNAYMASHANTPKVRLVDGRSPVFFSGAGGTTRDGQHRMTPGHIAGAVNIPFDAVFDDSSRVLPRAALERLFLAAGVQPGDTVVAYCHVGQQATAVLYAARILGHPVRLYDGSMDDWNKRSLPLVGAQP